MMGKMDCRLRRGAAAAAVCPDATMTKKARYLLKEEPDQACGPVEAFFFASLVCDGTDQVPSPRNHGAKRVLDCWQRWTRAPYYDGHEWRKYGEKYIASVGSKRCYYRCTHAPCPAKKRVENRSIGDPTLYLVTYEKEHTCNAAPAAAHHQLTLDPPPPAAPFSLSFYSQDSRMDPQQRHFQPALSGQITAATPESNGCCSSSSSSFDSTPCTMPAGSMEMENYDLAEVDLGDLDVLLWMD